jgi:hypothetical protein
MPIDLLASFIRTAKNVAPYLQLLSSHLSVTGYIASFDAERMKWCPLKRVTDKKAVDKEIKLSVMKAERV